MKLEDYLHQLPHHSAEGMLWDKIEEGLEHSASLSNKLPQHQASSELWYAIEARLNHVTIYRSLRLRLRHLSIAASIVVIITIGAVYFTQQQQTHLYYSDEISVEQVEIPDWTHQGIDVLDNCKEQPAVCATPDFTRLKTALDQLKGEEIKLRELKTISDDPKIELYHARIVRDIQQVESQLLHLFS